MPAFDEQALAADDTRGECWTARSDSSSTLSFELAHEA